MTTATRTVTPPGTSLANRASVPESPRPADVWRGRRNVLFVEEARRFSRWAIALGAFVHAAIIAIMIVDEYPSWRVIALASMYVGFATCQRLFVRRAADEKCVEASFIGINLTSQLFIISSAAITGGVHSPFLPALA